MSDLGCDSGVASSLFVIALIVCVCMCVCLCVCVWGGGGGVGAGERKCLILLSDIVFCFLSSLAIVSLREKKQAGWYNLIVYICFYACVFV